MPARLMGLIAIFILACGLLFLVVKWPQGSHKTFSQHAAARRLTIYYYISLFTLTLPLLALFFVNWFVPTFHLSIWFNIFVICSIIAEYIAVLVPEVGGRKTKIHRTVTAISATLLVPCMVILLSAASIGLTGKALVAIGLITMAAIVAITIVKNGAPKYFLWLQGIYYFGGFFGPILIITLMH